MGQSHIQCSPLMSLLPCRLPQSNFGENQLSPSSFGISPLATIHPPTFQRGSVRSSIKFSLNFNLIMARSLGFGSINTDSRPIKTRFRFGSDSSS